MTKTFTHFISDEKVLHVLSASLVVVWGDLDVLDEAQHRLEVSAYSFVSVHHLIFLTRFLTRGNQNASTCQI